MVCWCNSFILRFSKCSQAPLSCSFIIPQKTPKREFLAIYRIEFVPSVIYLAQACYNYITKKTPRKEFLVHFLKNF